MLASTETSKYAYNLWSLPTKINRKHHIILVNRSAKFGEDAYISLVSIMFTIKLSSCARINKSSQKTTTFPGGNQILKVTAN